MLYVRDIAKLLEEWAPVSVAEHYDNVGVLVGRYDTEVTGVLINLDVTEAVVEEAISLGVNMIVTHHPIWFGSRKRLNGEDYVSRIIMQAIKHDIVLYACHTNLDNIQTGVNKRICETLALQNVQFLRPKAREESYGSGMIGELAEGMSKEAFLAYVKTAFQCGGIRYADAAISEIRRVAVCGGAGSFLTGDAIKAGADAFVTADITYHKYFDNEDALLLLDIGHYESEQYTSALIYEFLSEKMPNFGIHLSSIKTNPIKYF